jgi:hypothetical protein
MDVHPHKLTQKYLLLREAESFAALNLPDY